MSPRTRKHCVYVGPGVGRFAVALGRQAAHARFSWELRLPNASDAWRESEARRCELDSIRRAAGLDSLSPLDYVLRAPHYTCTSEALCGSLRGGWRPAPGEASLAHGGVLLLSELEQFTRIALEGASAALASGRAVAVSGRSRVFIPAEAELVGVASSCPCGARGLGELWEAVRALKLPDDKQAAARGYLRDMGCGPRTQSKCGCTAEQVAKHEGRVAEALAALHTGGLLFDSVTTENAAKSLRDYIIRTSIA